MPNESEAKRMLQAQRNWNEKNLAKPAFRPVHLLFIAGAIAVGSGLVGYEWLRENTMIFASAAERCDKAISAADLKDVKTWQVAVQPCQKAVSENPNSASALFKLAKVEFAVGDEKESLIHLRRAVEMGDALSTFTLAQVTGSPAILRDAVRAYEREARSGTAQAAFAYAEINLWSEKDGFVVKSHERMLTDGTYDKFVDAAKKGAAKQIDALARSFHDPKKLPGNANNIAISDMLLAIAAAEGNSSATSGLAHRTFIKSRLAARDGEFDVAERKLVEAERLAQFAYQQSNRNNWEAGLLLQDIKTVRERPARMWAALLGGLAALGSKSAATDDSQEALERQREEDNRRSAKNAECMSIAFGSPTEDLVNDALIAGC